MDTSRPLRNKTRVLYIVESFSTGVYAVVRDIACNLDPDRFDVLILHSLRHDSPKDYLKDFQYPHITLSYIPMDSLKNYVISIKSIRHALASFQPDTIHLHSSKAGFLGRLASKRFSDAKILYSPHGFSFLRSDVNSLIRFIFLSLEKLINWYVPSRIISVSQGEMREAKKITSNTITINNFVDTQSIPTRKTHKEQIVVTTGRISAQKNPALFNKIAVALPHVSFVWVGNGSLRGVLTAPNVTVTGYVTRPQVFSYLTDATVYLQTSLWEGMPISILEAMTIGLPIVATDIIGNRDLIESNLTGFLCDPDDYKNFTVLIEKLLFDIGLQQTIGTKAREKVLEYYDIKIALKKYSEEYER